jgi:hypothetical protein
VHKSAQTNDRILISKYKSEGAENFLGTPTTTFEYLGNDESTNVGNEAQTNDQICFSKFQSGGGREMELI